MTETAASQGSSGCSFKNAFDLLPEVCGKLGGVSIPLNIILERVEYLLGQSIFDDAACMLIESFVVRDQFLDAVFREFLFDEVDNLPRRHRKARSKKLFLLSPVKIVSLRMQHISSQNRWHRNNFS